MLLTAPRDGHYPLVTTDSRLEELAHSLDPQEPLALDTERASGFTYNDGAYLVQLRQEGCGTFLVDAAALRDSIPKILAPRVNSCPWVLHAAISDLPCLEELSMRPPTLFDTEVAGRFLGFDKVNLAAMTNAILGIDLKKGHAAENWSKRPIPRSWLIYAALDVELLVELADALTELLDRDGKLDWAREEFAYIVANPPHHEPKSWLDVKGVRRMHGPQLQAARALFTTRDSIARKKDVAPGRILNNKLLSELASVHPTTASDAATIMRGRSNPRKWASVIRAALDEPRTSWAQLPHEEGTPSKGAWKRLSTPAWEALHEAHDILDEIATDRSVDAIVLLSPALLRDFIWGRIVDGDETGAEQKLLELGARHWQVELVASPLEEIL